MIHPDLKQTIVEFDKAKTEYIEKLENVLDEMLIASRDLVASLNNPEFLKDEENERMFDALCRAVSHAHAAKF